MQKAKICGFACLEAALNFCINCGMYFIPALYLYITHKSKPILINIKWRNGCQTKCVNCQIEDTYKDS